jgi:hypothetical protein
MYYIKMNYLIIEKNTQLTSDAPNVKLYTYDDQSLNNLKSDIHSLLSPTDITLQLMFNNITVFGKQSSTLLSINSKQITPNESLTSYKDTFNGVINDIKNISNVKSLTVQIITKNYAFTKAIGLGSYLPLNSTSLLATNGLIKQSASNLTSNTVLQSATVDVRPLIINKTLGISGLHYNATKKKFYLTHDITWSAIDIDNYITLQDGEIFDGNNYTINVGKHGKGESAGIFAIDPNVSTAPIIKNLHIKSNIANATDTNGTGNGGFIRIGQSTFTVSHCTHKGQIGRYGGGICGSFCSNFTIEHCRTSGIIGIFGGGITGTPCIIFTINHCSSNGYINYYAGGITGVCFECTINNCFSTGNICSYGGGIIGYDSNTGIIITNCHSSGSIGWYSGGICAYFTGGYTLENCYSTGNIDMLGGGISGGENYPLSINKCYSMGQIGSYGGGICGYMTTTRLAPLIISNCYSLGEIMENGGGIVSSIAFPNDASLNYVTVKECYSSGTIRNYAGGIVGTINNNHYSIVVAVNISECYSLGEIHEYSGGIVAYMLLNTHNTDSQININNCYSSGNIHFTGGGISAVYDNNINNASNLLIANCYASGKIMKSIDPVYASFGIINPVSQADNYVNDLTITNCYSCDTQNLNLNMIYGSINNLQSTIWKKTKKYPILRAFKKNPWNHKKYNKYTNKAKFI